jgi:predicted esterase
MKGHRKKNTMKPTMLFLTFLLLFVGTCKSEMEEPAIAGMSEVRGYKNWYIGDFRCGLFVPENYDPDKKYPLIVFLHGSTDTTTWDLPWYNEPIVTRDPCIVLTPKCLPEDHYGWGSSYDPRISPAMANALEMIRLAEAAFSLDDNRYYIYGSSMGGYGTYGVIMKNPGMFTAGYVECGNGTIEMAPILSEMPFWMFHGSEDPVVPVQPARDLYKAVLDYGGTRIRYTEYQGVGHNVWDYTPLETTLKTWLLAQRKGVTHSNPEAVTGFTAEELSGKVLLHWDVPQETYPPADNDPWYCRIYRDGNAIKEIYNNQNSFTDSTVSMNTTYQYQIRSVNYYFKESGLSPGITIRTTK